MKKVKKMTALVLAVLLCLSLTACDKTPADSTAATDTPASSTTTAPANTKPTETEPTEPVSGVTTRYLPAEVDNPDGLPVLKWVCLADEFYLESLRVWREDAVVELNQMLAERNMPFRVQFQFLMADQPMEYSEWFSVPEAQEALAGADLIFGLMLPEQMQQYLMPITEYASGTAQPSLENLVPHSLNWAVGTVDGQVYGVPAQIDALRPMTAGWLVEPAAFEEYGLSPEDFNNSLEDMEAIFAKIYSQNGGTPFLYLESGGFTQTTGTYASTATTCIPMELRALFNGSEHLAGACFTVDYSGESPKVINYLESDAVLSYKSTFMKYKAAGYITASTASAAVRQYFYGADHVCESFGKIYIPATEPVYAYTAPGHYLSGIGAGTEYKEEALSLLSLIADDEEFRMQLFYGKEGRDYQVENGVYTLLNDENGANYSLSCLFAISRFSGLYGEYASIEAPGTSPMPVKDGMNELQTYQSMIDNSFAFCPITFDYTGLEEETAAVQERMAFFYPYFTSAETIADNPFTEEEDPIEGGLSGEGYEIMLNEIKTAGGDKIQAELQRQLDEWLAANPDWQNP